MPYHDPIAATFMGVTTGLGSAVMQANAVISTPNPYVVPIVSAGVGGLMSFVVLKTTVRVLERDLSEIKHQVNDMNTRLARVEGAMGVGE